MCKIKRYSNEKAHSWHFSKWKRDWLIRAQVQESDTVGSFKLQPPFLSELLFSRSLSSQTKAVYRGILMTMENSTTLRKHMFCDWQLNRHQTNKHSVLNKVSHKNTGSFNFLICCFSCLWHFSWRCCYNVSLDLDNYLPCQLRTISHLAHLDLLHMPLKLRELGKKFKIHTCVVQFL